MNKERGEITLLRTASDLFDSWKWGDPVVTEEEVRETYIQAEKDARAMDTRLGTHYGRSSITQERLKHLGVDPETFQPAKEEKS